MRRRHRVALAGFAIVVFLLGSATAASAHANLVSTTPAQSAHFTAGAPPRIAAVVFDEEVHPTAKSISVYDGAGQAVAVRPGSDATTKRVEVGLPRLRDGTYVVVWHVVSDDGHPEHGAFTFSVGEGGASQADIGRLLAGQSSGRTIGMLFGLARALAFLGTLVVVGGTLFLVWRWPVALTWREVRRFLFVAGATGLVASVASVSLQAAYSTGDGTSALFDGGSIGDVLDARFGRAAIVRVVVLAAFVVALGAQDVLAVVVRAARGSRVAAALLGVASGIALATFAYAGHGYTGEWPVAAFILDVVHLGAAGLWLGGLVVLAVALRGHRSPADRRDGATRFSRLALPAIALVVISGMVQGWRQVHGWAALWHTDYSRLLVVKVLVVLAIVVVASAAREAVKDRFADRATLTELHQSVGVELALAVAVLAVTAALVVTPPAREAEAAASRPTARTVRVTADGPRVRYGVVVQPALAGDNTVVVSPALVSGGFLPAALEGVVGDGSGPSAAVTFTPLADGRWIGVARLTRSGSWHIDLTGSTGTAKDTASTVVKVR